MAVAQLVGGWLILPYKGSELATIEFKIEDNFYDAYLDFTGGQRIAKVRPPTGWDRSKPVELWVNGVRNE
jgi:hypothetical protein